MFVIKLVYTVFEKNVFNSLIFTFTVAPCFDIKNFCFVTTEQQ